MKVFVFGNPLIRGDALALRVGRELKRLGYNVVQRARPEALLSVERGVIIDCANVKDVQRISLHDLRVRRHCCSHSIDLATFLKIAAIVGELKGIEIIAIPKRGDAKTIAKKVCTLLEKK